MDKLCHEFVRYNFTEQTNRRGVAEEQRATSKSKPSTLAIKSRTLCVSSSADCCSYIAYVLSLWLMESTASKSIGPVCGKEMRYLLVQSLGGNKGSTCGGRCRNKGGRSADKRSKTYANRLQLRFLGVNETRSPYTEGAIPGPQCPNDDSLSSAGGGSVDGAAGATGAVCGGWPTPGTRPTSSDASSGAGASRSQIDATGVRRSSGGPVSNTPAKWYADCSSRVVGLLQKTSFARGLSWRCPARGSGTSTSYEMSPIKSDSSSKLTLAAGAV
eukprot:284818283_1